MFAQAIEAILQDHCTPAVVRAIEAGGTAGGLQATIAEAGFFDLLAEEEQGGAALTLAELYPVVALCGAYAVPLPVAQTMAARLLVARHGDLPAGSITFAPGCAPTADGSWLCAQVPCAMVADHVIASRQGRLWLLPVAGATRTSSGIHASLGATLQWAPGAGVPLQCPGDTIDLAALGAVLHAGLLTGAMKRVFDMTLQYGNDRVQFGKSIGKFQAIQHQLAVMAEHVAAASIAAEAAFPCARRAPSLLASAVAKSRASEAAQLVASIAHAVHGAIGVTHEYDLQLYTRRLHEWRMAHGSEAYWNVVVGRHVVDTDAPLLADFARGITA